MTAKTLLWMTMKRILRTQTQDKLTTHNVNRKVSSQDRWEWSCNNPHKLNPQLAPGLQVFTRTHLLRCCSSVQLHCKYVVTWPTLWDVTLKVTVDECLGRNTYKKASEKGSEVWGLQQEQSTNVHVAS